jgi:hypothetical protein
MRIDHHQATTMTCNNKQRKYAHFLIILSTIGIISYYRDNTVIETIRTSGRPEPTWALTGITQMDNKERDQYKTPEKELEKNHQTNDPEGTAEKESQRNIQNNPQGRRKYNSMDHLLLHSHKIPDNDNPRPLVKICLNSTDKAGPRVFQKPSCGNPLPMSSNSSAWNGVIDTKNLLEQCNNFALNAKGSKTTELLQLLHLRQALDDECWSKAAENDIGVRHKGAKDRIMDCWTGVIFPRQLIGYCQCGVIASSLNKTISYFFSGHTGKGGNREWVNLYINKSSAKVGYNVGGRDVRKETGTYDWDYYDNLRNSQFALAPDGEFYVWTYRFMEALMCGAIPVLDRRKVRSNALERGYHHCLVPKDGQDEESSCPYLHDPLLRQKAAIENWKNFVRRHSFVKEEW